MDVYSLETLWYTFWSDLGVSDGRDNRSTIKTKTDFLGKVEESVKMDIGAVVVAQLVERLLPIPEVRGSNPVIGKILFISIEHLFTINWVLERRK